MQLYHFTRKSMEKIKLNQFFPLNMVYMTWCNVIQLLWRGMVVEFHQGDFEGLK